MTDSTEVEPAARLIEHAISFERDLVIVHDEVPRTQINALLSICLFSQEGLHGQWRRALMINAHERLAIIHLWSEGSLSMSELGERIPLSRAAITSLIDRLERLGYVQRHADPTDRRRTVLKITDRVASLLKPVTGEYESTMRAVANEMDDAEWAAVTKFLRRVTNEARQAGARLRSFDDETLAAMIEAGQGGRG